MTIQQQKINVPQAHDRYNLISDLLVRHAQRGASRAPALYFRSRVISYGELYQQVGFARSILAGKGVMRSDRVALVLHDSPAYVCMFLAAVSLGAVPVGISPNENLSDLPNLLNHAGAACVVISQDNQSHRSMLSESGIPARIVEVDLWLTQEEVATLPEASACADYEMTSASDILYLTFSSGTTGMPKAVIRRHQDILHCARSVDSSLMKLTPDDRVMTVTKLTFGYSLVGGLMFSLLAGAALIIVEEVITADLAIETAEQYSPTVLLAQPRILTELTSRIDDGRRDWLTSLRLVMSAGDVLSPSVLRRWDDAAGVPMVEGFGSVEVGHFFLANTGEGVLQGAFNQPLEGYELRLVDERYEDVQDRQHGRLCIRGGSVTTGYWNDPERTRTVFRDGWYVSDDVFIRSGNCYMYAGRWDDMIKTGCGEWVSPARIESVIRRHDAVVDCAVKEARDENGISRVKAFIVANDRVKQKKLQSEIAELIEREWPRLDHMRVHIMDIVPAIPRSANGKIKRSLLA